MSIDIETAGKLMHDVQVAHRVVVGFYQRIIPLLDHVSEGMDCEFSYWRPLYTKRPSVGTTKPSKNWLWDMVPLYASRHVYRRVAGGGLQTSDRVIVFDIEVDEGFNTARKHGEPNPIEFEAGAARLYVDLYRASKESDETFEVVWNKAGDADRNKAEWHSVADHLEARSLGFDLAEFISDHKSVVDKLRELLVPTERIGFSDGVGPA